MPGYLKPYTIKPSQGGRLLTALSLENIPAADWSVKRNWRRVEEDREGIREGDVEFYPNKELPIGVQSLNLPVDITQICEVRRPNGERSVLAFTDTDIYRYVFGLGEWNPIGIGFTKGRRWQVVELNGYAVFNNAVNLPMTFRHEEASVKPIYELRESGIASVGVIAVFAGFFFIGDITEVQGNKLATVMNGSDPYGIVSAADTNRIRYKIAWSEWGEPRRWAPVIPATIAAKGREAVLDFPVSSDTLAAGSKIAVIGGDLNGGTLGGQEGVDDGLPVLSVSGTTITWDKVDSAEDGAYPIKVTICRFADISTISGYSSIQDDSSGILAMLPLGTSLIVYRDSSMWYGRYTGSKSAPFVFKEIIKTNKSLYYQNTLVDMGDTHIFAGAREFFVFDGTGEPQYAKALNDSANIFFGGLDISQTDRAFAAKNDLTGEVWFCQPNRILAYESQYKTTSEIDQPYTAAAMITRPAAAYTESRLDERWFVGAIGGKMVQYGLTREGFQTFHRQGMPYVCTLKSGLISMGDEFNRKDVRMYSVQLATDSSDAVCTLNMYSCEYPKGTLQQRFSVVRSDQGNVVPCLFRDTFFQDEFEVTTVVDALVTVSSRTFEIAPTRTRKR